jgi:tetratricopeptide repeat protein 21B
VFDSPLYHIIRAKTQKAQGELDESLKTLELALTLPGIRRKGSANNKSSSPAPSLQDQVVVYLELSDVQRQLGMQHEAAKTMQDAIDEFKGTPEEIKVTIANANFAVERGEIDSALGLLREISPDQSYYIQAREKMAEIYLKYRKDKRLYAGVYRELAEKNPTPQSLMLLGDAYISISEPEKAIEVFESALKKNPRDSLLASKIGEALVKTHQYGKAITYYENAVKTGQSNFLRLDLAELHMKLTNYDKAERVLKQALKEQTGNDLSMMVDEARCNLLLAQVFQKSKNVEETGAAFLRAREVQGKVLKRVGVEQPDELAAQKVQASKICSMLGDYCRDQKENEKAIKSYKEATFYNDSNPSSMLALAELHLTNGDLDACQQQLVTVLKTHKDNDTATVMMADLLFRKNEYDAATFHFQQLLERRPDNYEALSKLVELMRRAGKLAD